MPCRVLLFGSQRIYKFLLVPGVTEKRGQTLGTISIYQTRKHARVNMCPETLNLWIIAERVRSYGCSECPAWDSVNASTYVTEISSYMICQSNWKLYHRVGKMHDGFPANCSRSVRDGLNNSYHDEWIGRGGPSAWPPLWPELNPLYFYLWGYFKTLLYAGPVNKEDVLRCIVDDCQTIRNHTGIFYLMPAPWHWISWSTFEHLLYMCVHIYIYILFQLLP